jgi:hypothetical protein
MKNIVSQFWNFYQIFLLSISKHFLKKIKNSLNKEIFSQAFPFHNPQLPPKTPFNSHDGTIRRK